MFRNIPVFFICAIFISFGCGSNPLPNANAPANRETKLDPANMPAGLSAIPLPSSANMPAGISLNAVNMPIGNKPIPGIPTAEQLKKGFKPVKTPPIPGIPDEATIRKQMGLPNTNVNPPPKK